jgi:alginate O-acetyltransferase complex protein AlgI
VLFPTVTFAIFFSIVLPVSWLLMPRGTRWRIFMISASYFFYGYWNVRFVLLIVASTIWNQVWGTALHRLHNDRRRRVALTAAVAGNLGLLGYFKYAQFFEVSARNALNDIGIHVSPEILRVTLPVGISFFTFQAMSYIIDIYRRQIEPVNFLDFAVYISFFPHVVAGPIVRASEFLPQLEEKRDPRRVDAGRAFFLIISGLFKKVVLANFLATTLVDRVFSLPELHNGKEILFAIYGYAVQIYCDFSGYTDIAIGLALLLGFRFPQNFNAPYTAESLQDFWRRWHMTLTRWLRDYLYIPLGGNRAGERATYRNLMITMLLGGLWHGAAWTFVAWGAIHGGALTLEQYRHNLREAKGLAPPPDTVWRRLGRRVATFHVVCLGWVFFRAETFHVAWVVLTRLFVGWGSPTPLITGGVVLAIGFGIAMQYVPRNVIDRAQVVFSRLSPVQMGIAMAVALLFIDALGPQGVAPFIYFAF